MFACLDITFTLAVASVLLPVSVPTDTWIFETAKQASLLGLSSQRAPKTPEGAIFPKWQFDNLD